jgi:hypothetical protein
MLAYVNRLSDLLWLFSRRLEHDAGVSGSLREATGMTGKSLLGLRRSTGRFNELLLRLGDRGHP